jgi:hypothetical protein
MLTKTGGQAAQHAQRRGMQPLAVQYEHTYSVTVTAAGHGTAGQMRVAEQNTRAGAEQLR